MKKPIFVRKCLILTPNDARSTNSDTDQVFVQTEWPDLEDAAEGFYLDEGDLHDHRDNQNDHEEFVVEETIEGVDLIREELSCVNFVEDLKHHIGVEEEGVVSCLDWVLIERGLDIIHVA